MNNMKKDLLHKKSGINYNIDIKKTYYPDGKIKKQFTIDNQPLKFIEVINKNTRRLAGKQMIKKDLELIEAYISIYIDLSENMDKNFNPESNDIDYNSLKIIECIICTCITLYGKCFNSASDRGTTLTAKTEIYKKLPQYTDLHEFIIHLRNEFFCHSGISHAEKSGLKIVFHNSSKIPVLHAEFNYLLSNNFFHLFRELVLNLKISIEKDVFDSINKEALQYFSNNPNPTNFKDSFGLPPITWESWIQKKQKR